jgi:CDP-paratose 2-epimerase
LPERFLITGGAGFLGSNVAQEVMRRGGRVTIADNLSRVGAGANLQWLRTLGDFSFSRVDVRDEEGVDALVREVRPDAVLHLAGQVAMTMSIGDPRLDFETNARGSFNVLDAIRRHAPEAVVLYSSTNKVYGDLSEVRYEERTSRWVAPDYANGFDESLPLSFHGPYGCSKGTADQYMLDFARVYGIRTVVFRHSSIFGQRQFSTYDQGWIGWFVKEALVRAAGSSELISVSGDGKQVRDVLFASDAVACYLRAIEKIDEACGQAFNIGGGMRQSLSLIELFDLLMRLLDVELRITHKEWRAADQKVFVADIGKAHRILGWRPEISAEEGIRTMVEWTRAHV